MEENFIKVLIVCASLYGVYLCTIQFTWCIRKFLQRFTAVLPVAKETHKYKITFSQNMQHILIPECDLFFSIQGERGSSKFFVVPKRKQFDQRSSFSFYTKGCLQELYSITFQVQADRPMLWRIEFIQVVDIPHARHYIFPFYCDLHLTTFPLLYMSTAQAKFYPRCLVFGKHSLYDYHNFIAPFTNISLKSYMWPVIPLTFILSQTLNGFFYGMASILYHQLDWGQSLIIFLLSLYLILKVTLPDIIFRYSATRGADDHVWKRRAVQKHPPARLHADSDISIDRNFNAERDLLKALKQHPSVSAVYKTEPSFSFSASNNDSRVTSNMIEKIDDNEENLSIFNGITTSPSISPASYTVQKFDRPTIETCLFYPFNAKQLFENRVHLWTFFLELWQNLQEKTISACEQLQIPDYIFNNLNTITDATIFQKEFERICRFAKESQYHIQSLERLKLKDRLKKARRQTSVSTSVSRSHEVLISMIEREILYIICTVLQFLVSRKHYTSFPTNVKEKIGERVKSLVQNCFYMGYLYKQSSSTLEMDTVKVRVILPPFATKKFSFESQKNFHSDTNLNNSSDLKSTSSMPNVGSSIASTGNSSDILQHWFSWIPSFVSRISNSIHFMLEEKLLELSPEDAILFIQAQEENRLWEKACRLYIQAISYIIIDAFIFEFCHFLHKDIRYGLWVIITNNLKMDIKIAVMQTLLSFRNEVLDLSEVTDGILMLTQVLVHMFSQHSEHVTGLLQRFIYLKQLKLLFVFNGKIPVTSLKSSREFTQSMHKILETFSSKLQILKDGVSLLLEEFQHHTIDPNPTMDSNATATCTSAVLIFRQLDKSIVALELCLDAINLDIPHSALTFNAEEVDLQRVNNVLNSYFTDQHNLDLKSDGGSTHSLSSPRPPFPSAITLNSQHRSDPRIICMLRKPWVPKLPFYCGWIAMIFVACDIILTTVAIILHAQHIKSMDIQRALLIMAVGIFIDFFMLQPIKSVLIILISNCIYKRGVYEIYEAHQQLIQ